MELSIKNLSKLYKGNVWGLKDFNLSCKTGVLGLIGPNGAGKSTLMRILATVTKPTEGEAHWDGSNIVKSPNKVRRILGYLPQDFGVYPHLNPLEFLKYIAAAKGMSGLSANKRIHQLLELVNLTDYRKRRLGGFSGGMKQRIGIAQALLNDPKLLIVDEPTAGLDPEERVRFRNLLVELAGDRIVILSSHIVSDIEATVTDIAVINKGRLIMHTAPEELWKLAKGKTWEFTVPSTQIQEVKDRFLLTKTIRTEDGIRVRIVTDKALGDSAKVVEPSLEDGYLYLLWKQKNEERA